MELLQPETWALDLAASAAPGKADTVLVGWAIDAQSKSTYLDISMTAQQGTELAQQLGDVHVGLPALLARDRELGVERPRRGARRRSRDRPAARWKRATSTTDAAARIGRAACAWPERCRQCLIASA